MERERVEREREREDEILAGDYHLPPAELGKGEGAKSERDAKLPTSFRPHHDGRPQQAGVPWMPVLSLYCHQSNAESA